MGGGERERKRSFGRARSSLEQTTPPAELHSQQHMREHSAELASSPGSNTCDCNSCESGNNVRVAVGSQCSAVVTVALDMYLDSLLPPVDFVFSCLCSLAFISSQHVIAL